MAVRARDVLAQVPLFAGVPPRFIKRLAGEMDEQRFMEGATIVRKGEPGETFYVLVEGEAKVTDENGKRLAQLIPGDFFGEISLMDGGPSTATVVRRCCCSGVRPVISGRAVRWKEALTGGRVVIRPGWAAEARTKAGLKIWASSSSRRTRRSTMRCASGKLRTEKPC